MATTRRLLLAGALVLIAALLHANHAHGAGTRSVTLQPWPWRTSTASWYQPTGHHTSCGNRMVDDSWHVAALSSAEYRCGRLLTICNGKHCVKVQVRDRGAWRTDGRVWDLTPRVRTALRCDGVCTVKWHEGWKR